MNDFSQYLESAQQLLSLSPATLLELPLGSRVLLVIASVVLGFGLRSLRQRHLKKIGSLILLFSAFLPGWLLGKSVLLGFLGLSLWLFIPLIEVFMRARNMQLPLERKWQGRLAPNRQRFPELSEMTEEMIEAGFEQLEDIGWKWQETDHFTRLFYRAKDGLRASICMVEQEQMAFHYSSLSSLDSNEQHYCTLTYPFSGGLKIPPEYHIKRATHTESLDELLDEHQKFLKKKAFGKALISKHEDIETLVKEEANRQVNYNLEKKLINKTSDGTFQYSTRGLFYIWMHMLKDMIIFF